MFDSLVQSHRELQGLKAYRIKIDEPMVYIDLTCDARSLADAAIKFSKMSELRDWGKETLLTYVEEEK